MSIPKIRRVAVIGAGPAGAIATDALVKEQAFDRIRVFERKGQIGGTWVHDAAYKPRIDSLQAVIDGNADVPAEIPANFPCSTPMSLKTSSRALRFADTGVYDNLHSNLPPSTMCFTEEPLPGILSEQTLSRYGEGAPFRHWSVIRQWVEDIFMKGGHRGLVEFNTTVEKAEKHGSTWVLTLRQETEGAEQDRWWQEEFDAVVVATGHYNVPYLPNIPGLVEVEEQFPGTVSHSKHYRSKADFQGKKTIVVGGSVSAFDALHDIRTVSAGPVIASLREPLTAFGWTPFTHPDIVVKPPIAKVDPETRRVHFVDGSSEDNVDHIFFATGYDFSFPFLLGTRIRDRRIEGLYQHVFNIEDPTLGFVGMVAGGLTFRVFEWQAVALARLFAGRGTLPPKPDMERWELDRLRTKTPLGFFNIASGYEEYFEVLRSIAGPPESGTTGRLLPRFETWWAEEFGTVVEARKRWWAAEARKAAAADGESRHDGIVKIEAGSNGVL